MRTLFVATALFMSLFGHAANYYFSSTDGSDARSSSEAQNSTTPWKSLDKLNTVQSMFQAGDQILFKRGDTFYGSLVITRSGTGLLPVTFAAYGTGKKPVITGFTSLGGWSQTGQNIWETKNNTLGSAVNTLLNNELPKRIGRYPNYNNTNHGFLYFQNAVANTSISDNQISGFNFSGGEVVIRKNRWVVDRSKITSHAGSMINYTSQSGYWADKGYGYFVQNHLATLDQEGEWYYQPAEKKIGIYTTGGTNALKNIKASTINILVTINGQSNVVFDGLVFTGANTHSFFIKNASNIKIGNCEILFSGTNAVTADNTDRLTLENSTIAHSNNIAFNGIYCTNTVLKNNKINCTGIYAGMGEGDSGSYEAVMIAGNNNLVEQNTIDSTGYIPVTFSGNDVIVKNNHISNYSFVKDDGGAIYTWNNSSNPPGNTGRKVLNNIVLNGIGAGEGTPDKLKKYAHGIYIDDNATNVDVSFNTVASCEGFGVYIHNARDLAITNNMLYNNQVQISMIHDDIAPNSPVRNNTVTDNILFSLYAHQPVAEYKTKNNDLGNFGDFNRNYYCRPIDDNAVINTLKNVNGAYQFSQLDLQGWQAAYGKDGESKKTAKEIAGYKINDIIGGNKFANGSFNSNIGGLYSYASANNCVTQWKNEALDGGSLQVSFSNIAGNNNKGTIIINIGAVTANKRYIFRISTLGSDDNKMLEVYLRKSLSPYTDLTDRRLTKIQASRSETEFLFIPTETEANASIGIDVQEQTKPVYLDNVQLLEASVTPSDITDSVRFIYNANLVSNSFLLNSNFIDVKNNSFNGSISLNPFSSAVLINKTGNTVVAPPVQCSATGSILYEQWVNVGGNAISDNTWTNAPGNSKELTSFEGPENSGEQYASRVTGYICPPQTGNYTFWIAGDDATELWLSTDSTTGNKTKIAFNLSWTGSREWNKYSSQRSTLIYLEAGRKVYIEALHKEGNGGDNLSVAWQLPDGTIEGPIAGSRLSPYKTLQTSTANQVLIFSAPADVTFGIAPFALSATSSSGLPVSFQVVSGPATLSGNTIAITGAGVVNVEASQAGNASFNAAPVVLRSFTVFSGQSVSPCSATGTILREVWSNVGGNNINDNIWSKTPNSSNEVTSLEGAENSGDQYASRISGYICPPQSGKYIFWIAGDDATELWLSTDENPANKSKIAYSVSWTGLRSWNQNPGQKSIEIYLEMAKKYYIEALHKEGGGGDHVSVSWQLPNGVTEAPIPGSRLSPYTPTAVVALTNQTISFNTIGDVTFGSVPFILNATASSGLPVTYKVLSGPATINNNTITMSHTGVVSVEASQTGDATYNAAPVVLRTFTVLPAPLTTTCSATGTILKEVWNNVGGNNITDNVWSRTPNSSGDVTKFEGSENSGDQYATRISGYICPPQTGNYIFWIAGDDATELWLSTDASTGNKTKIAYNVSWTGSREWNRFGTQKSAAVYLEAGKKYYIEALHKEGAGGDNLAVAWQLPDNTIEAPIPGSRLSPYKPLQSLLIAPVITSSGVMFKAPLVNEKDLRVTSWLKVYPNPIKSTAIIQMQSGQSAKAQVSIYDLQNKLLQTIFTGTLEAKVLKTISFNRNNLPNGMYLIRFATGDNIITSKIIVAK